MLRDRITRARARGGALVLDGALATELERRGHDLDDALWSARLLADDPGAIEQVHLDYLRAGAEIVTSASYQATIAGFVRRALSEREAATLIARSVELAMRAVARFDAEVRSRGTVAERPLVAASIGPYGAFLADGSEYRGDYGLSVRELIDFHRGRLEILANSGADVLAFETIPCLAEAEAIVRLLEELPECVEAWISYSVRDGSTISSGEPIEEAIRLALGSPRVVLTGVNCTAPSVALEALSTARAISNAPLIAYPNSGERWDATRRVWVPGDGAAGDLASFAKEARSLGAALIGGCCRTTPADIAALSASP